MIAPPLAVAIAVTAFYFGALTTSRTVQAIPVDDDVATYFRPLTLDQFAYAHAHGHLPQWLARVGLGYPAAMVAQDGTSYPPRIAAMRWTSSPGTAADLLVWLHELIAGLAAFALARMLGVSRWSAALAGVSYALADLVVRWAPLFHSPPYFAAFPVGWLGLELIGRRRHAAGVLLLALGVGMSGLGSHLQNTHLLVQALVVIAIYRAFAVRGRRSLLGYLGASLTGFALGLAIASPVWLPFVIEQRDTTRQSSPFSGVVGMNAHTALSALDPVAALGQLNGDLYLGLAAPVLVLVGLAVCCRRRFTAVIPVLIGLSLLAGYKTPFLRGLMAVVPGWDVVSNVQRLSFVIVLPLALAVGIGADAIFGRARPWLAAALLVAASTVAWGTLTALHGVESPLVWTLAAIAIALAGVAAVRPNLAPGSALTLVPAALLVLTATAAVEARALGWKPVADRPPAKFERWLPLVAKENDVNGRWMSYCLSLTAPDYVYRPIAFLEVPGRWLDTYDSFVTTRYYDYWRTLTGSTLYERPLGGQWYQDTPGNPLPNAALVDAAGIDRVLASTSCAAPPGWERVAGRSGLVVYRNPAAFPLAYVSYRWRGVSTTATAVSKLASSPTPFATHTDYVVGGSPAPGSERSAQPATLVQRDSEHASVTLPPGRRTVSLLVVGTAWSHGWQARAAGHSLPVRIVNGVFQGVFVPANVSRVDFVYAPWWLGTLPVVSDVAAGLTLLGAVGYALGRRRWSIR